MKQGFNENSCIWLLLLILNLNHPLCLPQFDFARDAFLSLKVVVHSFWHLFWTIQFLEADEESIYMVKADDLVNNPSLLVDYSLPTKVAQNFHLAKMHWYMTDLAVNSDGFCKMGPPCGFGLPDVSGTCNECIVEEEEGYTFKFHCLH